MSYALILAAAIISGPADCADGKCHVAMTATSAPAAEHARTTKPLRTAARAVKHLRPLWTRSHHRPLLRRAFGRAACRRCR